MAKSSHLESEKINRQLSTSGSFKNTSGDLKADNVQAAILEVSKKPFAPTGSIATIKLDSTGGSNSNDGFVNAVRTLPKVLEILEKYNWQNKNVRIELAQNLTLTFSTYLDFSNVDNINSLTFNTGVRTVTLNGNLYLSSFYGIKTLLLTNFNIDANSRIYLENGAAFFLNANSLSGRNNSTNRTLVDSKFVDYVDLTFSSMTATALGSGNGGQPYKNLIDVAHCGFLSLTINNPNGSSNVPDIAVNNGLIECGNDVRNVKLAGTDGGINVLGKLIHTKAKNTGLLTLDGSTVFTYTNIGDLSNQVIIDGVDITLGGGTENNYVKVNSTGTNALALFAETIAIGSGSNSNGPASISIGQDAKSAGSDYGIAIGYGSSLEGGEGANDECIAIGKNAKVAGGQSKAIQLGEGTNVDGSTLQFLDNTLANKEGLYTPHRAVNYTASDADNVTSHLAGIDAALANVTTPTTLQNGISSLASDHDISSENTFEDIALQITVPGAGRWKLEAVLNTFSNGPDHLEIRGLITNSSNTKVNDGPSSGSLLNDYNPFSTGNNAVGNSSLLVGYVTTTGAETFKIRVRQTSNSPLNRVDSGSTLRYEQLPSQTVVNTSSSSVAKKHSYFEVSKDGTLSATASQDLERTNSIPTTVSPFIIPFNCRLDQVEIISNDTNNIVIELLINDAVVFTATQSNNNRATIIPGSSTTNGVTTNVDFDREDLLRIRYKSGSGPIVEPVVTVRYTEL